MSKHLETLLFIGKCLTISDNKKNRDEIENKIINEFINWDLFVKIGTSHLIFPSLFFNFKNTGLINIIPYELAEYMKHIFDLNNERNKEILLQVKELNLLLKTHGITPIFLKGASFLVENLYLNNGERMIGDIDILVSKKNYSLTIKILKNYGYSTSEKEEDLIFPSKHYPKMVKKGSIAAIEVHSKIILNKYSKVYNYRSFIKNSRKINNINIPSLENQIIHNFINKQFSDKGKFYRSPSFRNSYDLYRLSLKINPLIIIKNGEKKMLNTFNSYLLQTHFLFKHKNLYYIKNYKSKIERKLFLLLINNKNIYKIYRAIYNLSRKTKIRLLLMIKTLYKSDYRKYYFRKLREAKATIDN